MKLSTFAAYLFQAIRFLLTQPRSLNLSDPCPHEQNRFMKMKKVPPNYVLQGRSLQSPFSLDSINIYQGNKSESIVEAVKAPEIAFGAFSESKEDRHQHSPAYLALLEGRLVMAQAKINETKPNCFRIGDLASKAEFLIDRWASQLDGLNALVYPMCMDTGSLGNTLGSYLNEFACATLTGAHFIGTGSQTDSLLPREGSVNAEAHRAFFESFPDIYTNRANYSTELVRAKLNEECHVEKTPWDNPLAPWVKRIPLIRHLLRRAMQAMMDHIDVNKGTPFTNGTDLIALPGKSPTLFAPSNMPILPFIPDVAIQYRCSDNLPYGRLGYGLLPFRAFMSRIPADARFIYIYTEEPARTHSQPFCKNIVHELVDFIHDRLGHVTVLLKRGADPFMDFVGLAYANTSICSPSTFCLWPAIASNGTTHFPLTNLILQADASTTNRTNAPNLGSHFNWIFDTLIIAGKLKASWGLLGQLAAEPPPTAAPTVPPNTNTNTTATATATATA